MGTAEGHGWDFEETTRAKSEREKMGSGEERPGGGGGGGGEEEADGESREEKIR